MRVFVYGTLTDPDRARAVDPGATFGPRARLHGATLATGRYPTLVPGDGAVHGRLLDADREALDAYEGVDRGLYVRVPVAVAGSRRERGVESGAVETDHAEGDTWLADPVQTYVGDPTRLGVDAEWSGEGPLAERIAAYLDAEATLEPL